MVATTEQFDEIQSIADIEKFHPRPWCESTADGTALNDNGFSALILLLVMHKGCLGEKEEGLMNRCAAMGDGFAMCQLLEEAACHFIETHQPASADIKEASCVSGLSKQNLVALMDVFVLTCRALGQQERGGGQVRA